MYFQIINLKTNNIAYLITLKTKIYPSVNKRGNPSDLVNTICETVERI